MFFIWILFFCGKFYVLNRYVKVRYCGVKNKIRIGLFLYKDYIYEIDKVFCENYLCYFRFIFFLLYIKKWLFMIKGYVIKIWKLL